MATGFLHSSETQVRSTILESCELYMAVHAIECQRLLDRMNWDQVMDHFVKGLHDFFMKSIFMACFGPYTFIVS